VSINLVHGSHHHGLDDRGQEVVFFVFLVVHLAAHPMERASEAGRPSVGRQQGDLSVLGGDGQARVGDTLMVGPADVIAGDI
jgi:hypothetical protein